MAAKAMSPPSKAAETNSILPWPYGWLRSAGCPAKARLPRAERDPRLVFGAGNSGRRGELCCHTPIILRRTGRGERASGASVAIPVEHGGKERRQDHGPGRSQDHEPRPAERDATRLRER